jgi:hypothetical protein
MVSNLLKLIVNYLRKDGYWRDTLDKNMTIMHNTTITLICCNTCILIVYVSVLDTYFI